MTCYGRSKSSFTLNHLLRRPLNAVYQICWFRVQNLTGGGVGEEKEKMCIRPEKCFTITRRSYMMSISAAYSYVPG